MAEETLALLLLHVCPWASSSPLNSPLPLSFYNQNPCFPSRPNSTISKPHWFVSSLNSLFWIIHPSENLMKTTDFFPQGICVGIHACTLTCVSACTCVHVHIHAHTHTYFWVYHFSPWTNLKKALPLGPDEKNLGIGSLQVELSSSFDFHPPSSSNLFPRP